MDQKKFIKVVLRQEHIVVLGFRTTLIKGFDPLPMLTTVYRKCQEILKFMYIFQFKCTLRSCIMQFVLNYILSIYGSLFCLFCFFPKIMQLLCFGALITTEEQRETSTSLTKQRSATTPTTIKLHFFDGLWSLVSCSRVITYQTESKGKCFNEQMFQHCTDM